MAYAHAKVFEKDGNRFLIPGMWWLDDDHDGRSGSDVIIDAMMYSVVLGVKIEPEWLDIPVNDNGVADLHFREVRLCGPQFAHGAIDVYVISGPLFDDPKPSDAP